MSGEEASANVYKSDLSQRRSNVNMDLSIILTIIVLIKVLQIDMRIENMRIPIKLNGLALFYPYPLSI